MKLEKINENQIRCILNREDLVERQLRISELAYGSEKAKALFHEMMIQAESEFGFEADNIPLMIESIPISHDCLILNITKVEEPDELDTRFSNFTPFGDMEYAGFENTDFIADEIINCFEHIAEMMAKSVIGEDNQLMPPELPELSSQFTKVFSFDGISEVAELSHILIPFYFGENTLYKSPINGKYCLKLNMSEHTPEDFNKVCNIISEYGKSERLAYATCEYLDEHYEVVIKDRALQVLAEHF